MGEPIEIDIEDITRRQKEAYRKYLEQNPLDLEAFMSENDTVGAAIHKLTKQLKRIADCLEEKDYG